MQQNYLTISEAAWTLEILINGPRLHLSPTFSSLLVPPSSPSSRDSVTLAMLRVATLLRNDAQEQKLKLQQISHFGQCVLDIKVCSFAALCTLRSNTEPRDPG